ncbi:MULTISPECIES: BrnA antitoxin family protein [Methylosinus]|uniref:BrnA antitoxin family protein n=1 Tax=Methylosinus trichosporium (strain ATCC 35070 / NCIMB 11131 / UNIQEM 75 / OB3b) TaxID=595536 RepID=A0A2D2D0S9_METT3|nr:MULTISPECIES: BrnA antitoxin family protein [Methylosinus]ATQ68572.1 hypothetical protein CQW49_12280 [Methylosinus trichosporium OB3b]OBS52774.1 hypothetical protein A8B73_09210 [Methylosinus sp. 3S-1]
MKKSERITRVTAEEVRAMRARGETHTDWERVRAMSQSEADRLAQEEEGPLPDGWESSVEIGLPKRKQGVHIRLDSDVLEWFKARGPGYQTRINAVLRSFVRARERAEQKRSGASDPSP